MSLESVVVKEEYMADGFDFDFFDAQTSQEIKTKCGEVFMGETGYNLTFVCTQCLQSFADLPSFGEHIWDAHPIRKDETRALGGLQDNIPTLKAESTDEAVDSNLHSEEYENDELISQEEDTDLKECEADFSMEPIPPKRIKRRGETYCCFSCCLTFGNFGRYRNHYRTAHPDMIEKDDATDMELFNPTGFIPKVPEKMLCKYCLKTFHEPKTYHLHIVTDHTASIYSCPHCPKTFPNRGNRDYHVNVHKGIRPQCPHCHKTLSNPNNLRIHIMGHLNIKKFSCRFCDQKYVRGSDLRVHERIHTKEKPYQCDECGMSFRCQSKLKTHVARTHQKIRNHKCLLCEKAFFSSFSLKEHLRTHTRERPFLCEICHKKFRAKGNLRAHMLLHSDEKKYICKLCEKPFAQHSGLHKHMKTHGEIKKIKSTCNM